MVPPVSHRVSRVPWYSGSSPLEIDFRLPGSHRLWQAFPGLSANQFPLLDCPQPQRINPLVWPLPRSLATTSGISVDFSSSPYLDVSVQAVPHLRLFDSTQVDRVLLCRVSPFGNLRINGHLHLPEAYRSLSRPSSAPDAKAFPLRSFALDLISCCQEGLALVLKRLNYAGSEFFEIVLCYPFEKFHKSFLFPSVACSSYLVTLFSFQGAFFRLLSKPDPNIQSFECLHPISHYLTGTRPRRDAGSPAHKRFGEAKTLPQGQFICPEDVPSPLGHPI